MSPGLDEKILALYGRGLSTRDISAQPETLHGVRVSSTLTSEVTDSVLDVYREHSMFLGLFTTLFEFISRLN